MKTYFGFEILNMFNTGSQPITKSVVESPDSGIESTDSTASPLKIVLWVRAFKATGRLYIKPGFLIVRFGIFSSFQPCDVQP